MKQKRRKPYFEKRLLEEQAGVSLISWSEYRIIRSADDPVEEYSLAVYSVMVYDINM